jgi:hypothetical protein
LKYKRQLLDIFIDSSPYQETAMKKTIFVVTVALIATIGLMTAATIAIPMLENGNDNGHMQTAHAQLDSTCPSWYSPDCRDWYDHGDWWNQTP